MSFSFSAPARLASPSSYYEAHGDQNGQKKSSASDYDTFIKLLVAQMKNQDPTQPVDATQYVSQLASFSSVEQAVQTNAKLEALLANQTAKLEALLANQTIGQAGNYVGKQLSAEDGKVSGIVQSVTIYDDGLIATLDNGEKLIIGPGVKVSEPNKEVPKPIDKTDEAKPA